MSLPKLGFLTTLDIEREVEERAFEVDGAKADADASMRNERAPVSFMLEYMSKKVSSWNEVL